MKTIKASIEYVWKIIKSWWIFIGIIPSIYSVFQNYFPNLLHTPIFPSWSIYTIFLVSFIFSGFVVWREENKKVKELEKKLESNVDYKIIHEIKKIETIDTEKIEHRISALEEKTKNDPLSHISNTILNPFSINTDDLKEYLTEAKKFNNKIEGIYNLLLNIQNTGTEFDELINIKITPTNGTIILANKELQGVTHIPEDPAEYKNHLGYLSSINIHGNSNPQGFHREILSFKNNYIEVEINHLRPSEDVAIIWDGIYIKGTSFTLHMEITSKNLKQPLELIISNKIHK